MRASGSAPHLAIAVALVLAACSSPATSGSPSASTGAPSSEPVTAAASPTGAPSAAAPSSAPTSTVGPSPNLPSDAGYPELGYVNTFVMRVAVSNLNVRSKPSTSGTSNGKAPKGGLFMMYDWPIVANGYTWYSGFTLLTAQPGVLPELPTPIETGYDEVLGGWMATGTEDSPFLLPLAARCPTVRDLKNVAAMLASERLSCFATDTIELQGIFGCLEGCGGATAGAFEPEWLASPLEFDTLREPVADGAALALHFPPDGPAAPPQGSSIRVRGHFADPRASTCRITEIGTDGSLSIKIANGAAEQWCRGKFVVESVEVVGT